MNGSAPSVQFGLVTNPELPAILCCRIVDHNDKKDLTSAEQVLAKLLERSPECADAHFLLGMTCANPGEGKATKRHLEEYVRLDPNGCNVDTATKILTFFK